MPCQCSSQGADACSAIPGSRCDDESEACTCLPSYDLTANGNCQPSRIKYVSDGSSINPFVESNITTRGNQFTPEFGRDPVGKRKTFGVRPNFRRLRASGTVRVKKI